MGEKTGSRARRGFTLIELMIVVAVIAVIAAIAFPNYQDSVRRGRRGLVKSEMADLTQRAERFHSINNTYVGFWATVPAAQRNSPNTGGTVAYVLTQAEALNTFTITATPQAGQVADLCGVLGINQASVKTHSGGTLPQCW